MEQYKVILVDDEGLRAVCEKCGISAIIAIPENNAKNSAPQSVNYCVTDFRRTPVRLQICSLQFALCSTAFFALFSDLAIVSSCDKHIVVSIT